MDRASDDVLLLAGPTASGKSALAMEWARRCDARIVNADSMQVYRDLRVLTARPSRSDEASAPHRLYGSVDAAERYSVGRWRRDIEAELTGSGPLVIVGGTGLYFDALEKGVAAMPSVPAEVRRRWSAASLTDLRAWLSQHDPPSLGRIGTTDRQRLQRAAEVHDATGYSLAHWWAAGNGANALADRPVRRLVLEPDRAIVRDRIAQRFDSMIADGAIDEVRALLARNLPSDLPAMRAIGVPELGSFITGTMSIEEARGRAIIASRQYAKRQSTWFRNRFDSRWVRVRSIDDAGAALGAA